MLAEVGDIVKKGDILAKIDDKELSQQVKELEVERERILAQYREAMKSTDEKEIEKFIPKPLVRCRI